MLSRRKWLWLTVGGAAGALVSSAERALALSAPPRVLTVYKTPTCGCCRLWVDHARLTIPGAEIRTIDMADLAEIKDRLGVPAALHSCHTAITGPYVFEGHIPGHVIAKFLNERPKALGLAVPGMPVGSPGMELGSRRQPYDVLLMERNGKTSVYARM